MGGQRRHVRVGVQDAMSPVDGMGGDQRRFGPLQRDASAPQNARKTGRP